MPNAMVAIVEDNSSVREAMTALVESYGIMVVCHDTAEAFLDCKRSQSASCLVADVQMPGMSGLDLQDALRTSGSRMPVIFVTSFPDERIIARALAGGALACLGKPAPAEELIDLIRTGLAVQSA